MSIKVGLLVEFMQDNTPTLGYVLDEQGGKIRLLLANRREINLTQSRLLPWIGPIIQATAKEDIVSGLIAHKELRQKTKENIDITELWKMTQGEVTEESADFFAGLMENNINPDIVAGYAHALLEYKNYFKFQNPLFEVYSQETAEAKLLAEKQQKEKTALVSGGADWFKHLWDLYCKHQHVTDKDKAKEPPEPVAATLKGLLLKHMTETESHEENLLWKQVTKQIPDETYLAYYLAVTWKLVPEHYNFWLSKIDYDETDNFALPFADELAAIQELAKKLSEKENFNPLPLPREQSRYKNALHCSLDKKQELCGIFSSIAQKEFISIDSASTKDIDDAFSFEEHADQTKEIHISLACPAFFWQFQSDFDKIIAKRCTSIYLPEKNLHMLPEELSTNSFSLVENQIKPSMLIKAVFNAENELIDCSISFSRVHVCDNLQYSACEAVLSETISQIEEAKETVRQSSCHYPVNEERYAPDENALAKARKYGALLEKAYLFAEAHMQKRIENGAVIIERDEYDLYLEGTGSKTQVHLEPMPQSPKAQLIVSELMVIANSIAADFAVSHEIPLFFRTQHIGIPKEMAGIWKKPEEIAKIARLLSPALTEIEAKPHTGLGLKAYSPVTSPLRRYADLVNQAQIMHFTFFQEPLFNKEEMENMLMNFNIHNGLASQVQRSRPRYWRFVFIQQEAKRQGENCSFHGIISDENDMYVTVSLTREQILVRAKRQLFGDKALLGQEVLVRLGKINPLLFEASIMNVQEL